IPALNLLWDPGKPGDSLALRVKVDLPQGWYINSHAPLDSFLVPTRLEASAPGLAFGFPRWPKPIVEHSDAMAGDMSLFKQDFEAVIKAAPPASAGPAGKAPPVRVTLHYQSCDGTMCWPPKAVSAVLRDGLTFSE
ncbi:MAG TPA: protein-disulfide reductase DsbD domain-containing protein, partial [Fibrobacteria bacterium]|nr:protein-disulfide reductase DsbD domain-containing protein [Fibrobacteria bacterium]